MYSCSSWIWFFFSLCLFSSLYRSLALIVCWKPYNFSCLPCFRLFTWIRIGKSLELSLWTNRKKKSMVEKTNIFNTQKRNHYRCRSSNRFSHLWCIKIQKIQIQQIQTEAHKTSLKHSPVRLLFCLFRLLPFPLMDCQILLAGFSFLRIFFESIHWYGFLISCRVNVELSV